MSQEDEIIDFEIHCDDEPVAWTSGVREESFKEALHYASQYSQDGKVKVYEIKRIEVAIPHYFEEIPEDWTI